MSESAKADRKKRFANHVYQKETRDSLFYKPWRQAVLLRDNFTCRNCGKKPQGRQLCVHHTKKWELEENREVRFSVENGITLCRSCHMRLHRLEHLGREEEYNQMLEKIESTAV